MEPSIGHQTMEPFKGHQTLKPFKGHQAMELLKATKQWNLQGPPSNGTFHWPLSWDLPSPPSFSFSLKGRIQIISGFLFSRHNFWFKS
jgi:hypothetical protein